MLYTPLQSIEKGTAIQGVLTIICGVSTGKRQYPYVETVVSRLRNSRFLPWKL